nr:ANAPC2 protein [Homo sapiens]
MTQASQRTGSRTLWMPIQGSRAPSGVHRTSSACWSASTAARTSSSMSTARCWPTACCTSSASAPSGRSATWSC